MKRLAVFIVGSLLCANSALATENAWSGNISDSICDRSHKSKRAAPRPRRRATGNPQTERAAFDVDSIPAGLAMDQLVAQEVMGEPLGAETYSSWWVKGEGDSNRPWSPSTQDSAAYGVIAAVWTRFGLNFAHGGDQTCHIAYFALSSKHESAVKATGRAETFALAVCRAALKAARSG
jgi:hypothetical protein